MNPISSLERSKINRAKISIAAQRRLVVTTSDIVQGREHVFYFLFRGDLERSTMAMNDANRLRTAHGRYDSNVNISG
jgi:hypothetical protein